MVIDSLEPTPMTTADIHGLLGQIIMALRNITESNAALTAHHERQTANLAVMQNLLQENNNRLTQLQDLHEQSKVVHAKIEKQLGEIKESSVEISRKNQAMLTQIQKLSAEQDDLNESAGMTCRK